MTLTAHHHQAAQSLNQFCCFWPKDSWRRASGMTCIYARHITRQYRQLTVTETQSESMQVWHLHCLVPQHWHAYSITYSSSGHWQCQLLRIICPSVFCLPCPSGLSAVAAMTVLHSVGRCQFAAASTVKRKSGQQTEQASTRTVTPCFRYLCTSLTHFHTGCCKPVTLQSMLEWPCPGMCRKAISLGGLMRNRLTLDELGSECCNKHSCSICFISSQSACIAAVFSAYISSICACIAAVFSAHLSILHAMRPSATVHVTNNKHYCEQNCQKYTLCSAATLQR